MCTARSVRVGLIPDWFIPPPFVRYLGRRLAAPPPRAATVFALCHRFSQLYRWHTGFPGGLKERPAVDQLVRKPEEVRSVGREQQHLLAALNEFL